MYYRLSNKIIQSEIKNYILRKTYKLNLLVFNRNIIPGSGVKRLPEDGVRATEEELQTVE